MTIEEAFDIVDKTLGIEVCQKCVIQGCDKCEIYIACKKLKECAKKETPRSPLIDEAIRRGCPVCCTELGNDDGYCPNCGQRVGD